MLRSVLSLPVALVAGVLAAGGNPATGPVHGTSKPTGAGVNEQAEINTLREEIERLRREIKQLMVREAEEKAPEGPATTRNIFPDIISPSVPLTDPVIPSGPLTDPALTTGPASITSGTRSTGPLMIGGGGIVGGTPGNMNLRPTTGTGIGTTATGTTATHRTGEGAMLRQLLHEVGHLERMVEKLEHQEMNHSTGHSASTGPVIIGGSTTGVHSSSTQPHTNTSTGPVIIGGSTTATTKPTGTTGSTTTGTTTHTNTTTHFTTTNHNTTTTTGSTGSSTTHHTTSGTSSKPASHTHGH
jgi:hypothetical protein